MKWGDGLTVIAVTAEDVAFAVAAAGRGVCAVAADEGGVEPGFVEWGAAVCGDVGGEEGEEGGGLDGDVHAGWIEGVSVGEGSWW